MVRLIEQDPRPWPKLGATDEIASAYFPLKSPQELRELPAEAQELVDEIRALGFAVDINHHFKLAANTFADAVLTIVASAGVLVTLNAALRAAIQIPENWRKLVELLKRKDRALLSPALQLDVIYRWLDTTYSSGWRLDLNNIHVRQIADACVFEFQEMLRGVHHRILLLDGESISLPPAELKSEECADALSANSAPSRTTGTAVSPRRALQESHNDSDVDIGILTIRDDEFRAVLGVFPDNLGMYKGARREYALRRATAGSRGLYRLAILRQIEQGNGEAQNAARDLIEDLAPRLVLVVGIAGGLPSDDVTLGDVVLSTRIHDFTVGAQKFGETTYAVTGGPIDSVLAGAIANLAAREDEMGDWTADLPSKPCVAWQSGQLYGPEEWQRELGERLAIHYGEHTSPRAPKYVAGPIASSDRLVKDPALLFPWIATARGLLAIEMESGGVYRAARERCPMLAIRGISDIVGLKRADSWTKFACASAAAFTRAFLRTRPVPVREPGPNPQ